ncbi:NUDIX domain-containing protein [Shinella daejeonensis]|uniref:NUDIX domain-containing protein n=1 Tax=Shinella daejeonensis TaxID=659017 RepID=UPI0020C7692C|nr:NUDIX domain-containing protein [Shinella daejeonensis]MCP8895672.1 NUDIX domain-containing protein [Shinella daejeonensis]
MAETSSTIRILDRKTVWKRFIHLQTLVLEQRRADGRIERLDREVHDHGHAAAVLLVDPARRSVVLVRQFRPGAFLGGHPDGYLLEVPAGLLDGDSPEAAVSREAMEETGYAVSGVRFLFDTYVSPGTLTERVSCFVATVDAGRPDGAGGGVEGEGEDIEIVEMPVDEACALIASGGIVDAKTILLLQWLMLERAGLMPAGPA